MKTIKNLLLAFIAFTTLLATSCATSAHSSGNAVTKELNGIAFENLDISSFFKVKFTQSEQYKAKVVISERFEPYLVSKIEDGQLVIAIDTQNRIFNVENEDTALVEISAPSFKEIELSGAVKMTLEGDWKVDVASLDLSGAAKLTSESLQVQELEIEQSGASQIHATLSVDELDVDNSGASRLTLKRLDQKTGRVATLDVSGSSRVDLDNYPFEKVVVDASGASHVTVYPVHRLNADASGASSIRYVNASNKLSTNLDKSGAASISAD